MSNKDVVFTKRQYLIVQAIWHGADAMTAIEAVSSLAIEHPEWDMDEVRTLDQWMGKR